MKNSKQGVSVKKPVYTCPLCGKEILGTHIFGVKDFDGDTPELVQTGLSVMSHRCGDVPTVNIFRRGDVPPGFFGTTPRNGYGV